MKKFDGAVRGAGGCCSITACVSPDARRSAITGYNEWRGAVEIDVAAEPREGEANAELLRFLATILNLGAGALEIASGARSTKKVVRVKGMSADECVSKLAEAYERG